MDSSSVGVDGVYPGPPGAAVVSSGVSGVSPGPDGDGGVIDGPPAPGAPPGPIEGGVEDGPPAPGGPEPIGGPAVGIINPSSGNSLITKSNLAAIAGLFKDGI